MRDNRAVLRGWLASHFLVMRALLLCQFHALSMELPLLTQPADSPIDAIGTSDRLRFRFKPRPSAPAQFVIDLAFD